MKYVSAFFFAFFAAAALSAQCNVHIFAVQDLHFYVYIDGKLQNAEPQKNLRITGVPEGNCILRLEFYNTDVPPVQTHSLLKSKMESAFMLNMSGGEGGEVSFKEYSCVPINQVNVQVKQATVSYASSGVQRNPNAKVEENSGAFAGRHQTGVKTGSDIPEKQPETANNTETSGSKDKKPKEEPCQEGKKEEVTEVKTYRAKDDGQGGKTILCERLITTKTIICQNGMEMVGSEEVKRTSTTPFRCQPRNDAEFAEVLNRLRAAANLLEEAKRATENQCMAPDQLVFIADLLDEQAKGEYARFAKPFSAHPTEYALEPLLPKDQPLTHNDNTNNTNNANNNTLIANENNVANNNENNTTNTDPGKTKKGKKEKPAKKPKNEK